MTNQLYEYLMLEIPALIEDFIEAECGKINMPEFKNKEGIHYDYYKSTIHEALKDILLEYK